VRAILLQSGKVERAALVDQELERIDAEIDRLGLTVEHDHDH
jgi:ribosome assembly protein YihI (activator of Der GTPase)